MLCDVLYLIGLILRHSLYFITAVARKVPDCWFHSLLPFKALSTFLYNGVPTTTLSASLWTTVWFPVLSGIRRSRWSLNFFYHSLHDMITCTLCYLTISNMFYWFCSRFRSFLQHFSLFFSFFFSLLQIVPSNKY